MKRLGGSGTETKGRKPTEGEKIAVVTLGCSKNVVDSEHLLGQLTKGGASIVESADDADVVVINTCGFIDAAKTESIEAILEAVERKKRGELKRVLVMGCLSERFKEDLRSEIPDVDEYFGTRHLKEVAASLGIDYRAELLGERFLTTPSHFAYLKISEGCDHPCSFCAIPLMRGNHVTRAADELVDEARRLAARGVKELIIIGQDTTAYGIDRSGKRELAGLLRRLAGVDGIEWMRLMYAYPAQFPLDILDVFNETPKLCRYLDIPVQHASDAVLRSMRRGISARATRDLVRTITERVPGIALRTTCIVGYPEETDDEFRRLYDFVAEMKFHRLGVFTYSHEAGTTAFELGDRIPAEVKEERYRSIMELQRGIAEERNLSLVGSRQRMLVDSIEDNCAFGRTEWDAPEIDQEIVVQNAAQVKKGSFQMVRVVDAGEYDLEAVLEP